MSYAVTGWRAPGGSPRIGVALGVILTVIMMLGGADTGHAGFTDSTLYSFTGGGHGALPNSLIASDNGVLYGTAGHLNPAAPDSVFALTPPTDPDGAWTESTLFTFPANTVTAQLISVWNGALYGLLSATCAKGTDCSTIFALIPPSSPGEPWNETFLYRFPGQSVVDLVVAKGVMYGITDQNKIFSLTPPANSGGGWTANIIGTYPGTYPFFEGLSVDASGTIFGTTQIGGDHNSGSVFALTPPATNGSPWTSSTLYSFTNGDDGGYPGSGVIIDPNGTLFGTTYGGGASSIGTIYSLTPPVSSGGAWAENVLHSFRDRADGGIPSTGLVRSNDGVLFGGTLSGGAFGGGTVFALLPPTASGGAWTETVLDSFPNSPSGPGLGSPNNLLLTPTGFYGTTKRGGDFDEGTVFGITVTP